MAKEKLVITCGRHRDALAVSYRDTSGVAWQMCDVRRFQHASFEGEQLKRKTQMKKSIKAALAITTLSILLPCAFIRAQVPSTTTQQIAAQTLRLQGSWEGVLVGQEAAGKCTITISDNSLHFQGLNTNEWYKTTFILPEGTAPQQLHATIRGSRSPDLVGKVVLTIFKIEDETLTIAGLEASDEEPPKTFDGDKSAKIVGGTPNLLGFELSALEKPKDFEGEHTFRYVLKKVQPQKKKNSGPPQSK